ncbi:sterol desaturase family protein [Oceanibacterium hippocampi]|uniref:Fatty acid hydroxylase superfamily protein n=1 Tax=Oceanibacterium hippocampi TaxID=745714 RepID=A0A1Y5U1F6_9PROT|nr:sterol desaturase family protein [Oceanibacterium hippocampi]SLN76220.1 Fatty acid hydroxylase superfamily protein [Oceanibacterium hippocampi]
MKPSIGPWSGKKYFLDKMSFRDLVGAYFTHYAVMTYIALGAVLTVLAVRWTENVPASLVAAAIVLPIYPLVWYLLHRYVLHGRWLYRSPLTASLWKRIHFDHHQDPNDLSVLFGALYTTLPTIAMVTIPIGWLIGGPGAAAAAFASGVFTTCFYEFCHCVQHLRFVPKWQWLMRIKKLHLAHHFHSEKGNYGITNYFWDRVLGTLYNEPKRFPRSATVFNLGYDEEEARRFPWVAALTPARAEGAEERRAGAR